MTVMILMIVCGGLSASLGGLCAHPKSGIDRSPSLPASSNATSSLEEVDDDNDNNDYDDDDDDDDDDNDEDQVPIHVQIHDGEYFTQSYSSPFSIYATRWFSIMIINMMILRVIRTQ